MSMMQSQSLTKKTGSPNDGDKDDEDDVGALIYREVQLRKAEAAAAAAESKKTSSASTRRRTLTRKRSPVTNKVDTSSPSPKRKRASKRKRGSSLGEDLSGKMVARKKYRYECSADGCTNYAQKGGVCVRDGAKVKRCSSEECTNQAKKGGVCMKHGAKVNAEVNDAQIVLRKEEYVLSMEQRSNDKAWSKCQMMHQ